MFRLSAGLSSEVPKHARKKADPQARSFQIDPDASDSEKLHWLRYTHYLPTGPDWTLVEKGQVEKGQSVAGLAKTLGKIDVKEIRYLSPRAATDRWGEGHPGGVIHVTTIQGAGPDTTESR